MEFVLINADKLKVSLNRQDLLGLGIQYDDMDYTDEETRKALIGLLEKGRTQVGFNPKRAKLFIEAYPSEGGGCVLYFSCLRGGEAFACGRLSAGPDPVVFEFDDAETLIEACAKAAERYGHRIYKSSLYRYGECWRLVIFPLDYSDRLSIYFLSEYGRRTGENEIAAAYTDEHGRLLIGGDAIDVIAEKLADG